MLHNIQHWSYSYSACTYYLLSAENVSGASRPASQIVATVKGLWVPQMSFRILRPGRRPTSSRAAEHRSTSSGASERNHVSQNVVLRHHGPMNVAVRPPLTQNVTTRLYEPQLERHQMSSCASSCRPTSSLASEQQCLNVRMPA